MITPDDLAAWRARYRGRYGCHGIDRADDVAAITLPNGARMVAMSDDGEGVWILATHGVAWFPSVHDLRNLALEFENDRGIITAEPWIAAAYRIIADEIEAHR